MTRNRQAHTRPEHVEPGQVYIQVHEPKRDSLGRVTFHTYWHAHAQRDVIAGRQGGEVIVRGQVFFADEREHAREWRQQGYRVFTWPGKEELTG